MMITLLPLRPLKLRVKMGITSNLFQEAKNVSKHLIVLFYRKAFLYFFLFPEFRKNRWQTDIYGLLRELNVY